VLARRAQDPGLNCDVRRRSLNGGEQLDRSPDDSDLDRHFLARKLSLAMRWPREQR
jgi:hypothetical protein